MLRSFCLSTWMDARSRFSVRQSFRLSVLIHHNLNNKAADFSKDLVRTGKPKHQTEGSAEVGACFHRHVPMIDPAGAVRNSASSYAKFSNLRLHHNYFAHENCSVCRVTILRVTRYRLMIWTASDRLPCAGRCGARSIGMHLVLERTIDLRRHKLNRRPWIRRPARRGFRMRHPSEPGVLLNCQEAVMYLTFDDRRTRTYLKIV